ncbi:hypothetical protein [Enterovirga rhinocerotis]|uniref:Uncharacterized protein n=1 Tax=Enterovirga rhinocerotis TaxID=1339210 RepID=A0A4R7CAW9_9HYPH|nr:hypothetical protein [Enterovirga rhinocerotis]TDR94545.1 hypothetical protein EV668_1833 [Enterovirga rhinocerotis]
MLDPASFAVEPAAGRNCGSCTLCCKVYDVPALEKPAGRWCDHCKPGRGCGIHATRPDHCRAFFCLWMTQTWLGPEWKPERAKMVLTVDPVTSFLLVQVDPGAPNAWRGNPYYGHLKQWAAGAVARGRQVIVFLNKSATVILPDRDVPLGILGPSDRIVMRERQTPAGRVFDVEKIAA